jgi:RNA polymerase sigma factor (TIGR02999 family)
VTDDVTKLLGRFCRADPAATADLFAVLYTELRGLARREFRRERSDHTLQPTALVHEVFMRLVPQRGREWKNRAQFLAVCAQAMRQVLIDHARRRGARKRRSGPRLALDEVNEPGARPVLSEVDLMDLDRGLRDLAKLDERRALVLEMRYFAGMTLPEIAAALDRSEWEVKKDWMVAKAWLTRRLRESR